MNNLTATVSLLELIWVIIGSGGLATHFTFLLYCVADKKIAKKHTTAVPIMIVANTGIRRQVIYAAVQLGMVALGINSMTAPPNPIAPTMAANIGATIIILIELFLVANALLDHRDRKVLLSAVGGRRVGDVS